MTSASIALIVLTIASCSVQQAQVCRHGMNRRTTLSLLLHLIKALLLRCRHAWRLTVGTAPALRQHCLMLEDAEKTSAALRRRSTIPSVTAAGAWRPQSRRALLGGSSPNWRTAAVYRAGSHVKVTGAVRTAAVGSVTAAASAAYFQPSGRSLLALRGATGQLRVDVTLGQRRQPPPGPRLSAGRRAGGGGAPARPPAVRRLHQAPRAGE